MAQGNTQVEGLDYSKTFTPVTKMTPGQNSANPELYIKYIKLYLLLLMF